MQRISGRSMDRDRKSGKMVAQRIWNHPLYEICVKMQCRDEQEEKRFFVGLRTMEVRREEDADGESFAFLCK